MKILEPLPPHKRKLATYLAAIVLFFRISRETISTYHLFIVTTLRRTFFFLNSKLFLALLI